MKIAKLALIHELKSQKVSVGIFASNWLKLEGSLAILSSNQMNLLHFDIADGQFSPMFTVGTAAIKQVPDNFYKDVHLMVKNQAKQAEESVKNGATIVTLQLESDGNIDEILMWINSQSAVHNNKQPILSGLSICPETELLSLQAFLDVIDIVHILTLDPRTGIKADEFSVLTRIKSIINILGERRKDKIITLDGSMTLDLAIKAKQLGVDWVVAGSALFADNNLDSHLMQWRHALC